MTDVLSRDTGQEPVPYSPRIDLAYLACEISDHPEGPKRAVFGNAFAVAALIDSYFRHIEANFQPDVPGASRSFEDRPELFDLLTTVLGQSMQEIIEQ